MLDVLMEFLNHAVNNAEIAADAVSLSCGVYCRLCSKSEIEQLDQLFVHILSVLRQGKDEVLRAPDVIKSVQKLCATVITHLSDRTHLMVMLVRYLKGVEDTYFDIYLKAQLFQYICRLITVDKLDTRKEVAELFRLKYAPLVQDQTLFDPIPLDDDVCSEQELSQSHASAVEPSVVRQSGAPESQAPNPEP